MDEEHGRDDITMTIQSALLQDGGKFWMIRRRHEKTVEQNSSARVVYVMADPFFALSDILLVGTASSGWSELHFCLKPSLSPKITFVPKNFG